MDDFFLVKMDKCGQGADQHFPDKRLVEWLLVLPGLGNTRI